MDYFLERSNLLSPDCFLKLLSFVKWQREDYGGARNENALLLLEDENSCIGITQVLYIDDDTVLAQTIVV